MCLTVNLCIEYNSKSKNCFSKGDNKIGPFFIGVIIYVAFAILLANKHTTIHDSSEKWLHGTTWHKYDDFYVHI